MLSGLHGESSANGGVGRLENCRYTFAGGLSCRNEVAIRKAIIAVGHVRRAGETSATLSLFLSTKTERILFRKK